VREAVRRLVLEGLVVVYPRRGTFATAINLTSLSDITDVRLQLEPHAAERAARLADDRDRGEAHELIARLDAAAASQRSLIELDAHVHRFVYRCSRNPYLAQDLDRYLNMSLRIWHLTWNRLPPLHDRVREHRELLEAIAGGDAERARAIAHAHVLAFAGEMRAVL
jgi:DNA-binding GntR family transcriptional regulator